MDVFLLLMRPCQHVACRILGVFTDIRAEYNLYRFYYRKLLNPYEITPPQSIRTKPISRELQLARQKPLHRCAPLVHAVLSISLGLTIFNVLRSEVPEGGNL